MFCPYALTHFAYNVLGVTDRLTINSDAWIRPLRPASQANWKQCNRVVTVIVIIAAAAAAAAAASVDDDDIVAFIFAVTVVIFIIMIVILES